MRENEKRRLWGGKKRAECWRFTYGASTTMFDSYKEKSEVHMAQY